MWSALVLVCNLSLTECFVIASPMLFRSEDFCYMALGEFVSGLVEEPITEGYIPVDGMCVVWGEKV